MKNFFYLVFATSALFIFASCNKFSEETQSDSEDVLKMEMDENDFQNYFCIFVSRRERERKVNIYYVIINRNTVRNTMGRRLEQR